MRRIGVAGVGLVLALLAFTGPARADLLVSISKSQQRLSVTVDGQEAYRWPVSTGRRGYTTPSGTFHPERLERHWYSHKYENSPMPWSVFFHRGYAMHGTMEAYHLGHAASHGCVRLRPDHAAVLFSLVRQEGARHTRIVISDKALPKPRHAPGNVPVAEKEGTHAALSARRHSAQQDMDEAYAAHAEAEPALPRALPIATHARDAAWLKRDTEAWLRSLDRKYGIVR